MALIEWSDSLSVEDEELDTQHKRLVSLLNNLHESMRTGQGKAVLGTTLNELIDYTAQHFQAEEALCEQAGYPDLDKHREEHRKLVNQVSELRGKFEDGSLLLSVEVLQFLKDWVTEHITHSDSRYTSYIKRWRFANS
jgi:hemerythrin-like metal-binding protein